MTSPSPDSPFPPLPSSRGDEFRGLGQDPDLDVDDSTGTERPVHLRWRFIGLVTLGGTIGTGLREALALSFPAAPGTIPVTILLINVVGAFALGLLLESLVRRGPDAGRRRDLRLLIGTGVLGGFTTYSALAVDTATLFGDAPSIAIAYGVGSVVLGAVASWAGITGGAALHRRSEAAS
ncbi:camphor resistance protein CrcB [Frigoribacterium sp. PhB160]|uniref:fluoride efflux transporter FluC n=1 Tax=Frigoribacterium sp. PhB160 TaxID=2485192 RepID=UPI000F49E92B|nr:CrcB family protein [Frigoribacterium sp. PhB160]ROS61206.1 camphor resistance protein CrcB [Frigoribacterium sp. PhB160]